MKKSTIGFFVVIALLATISANAKIVFNDTFSAGGAVVWTLAGAADIRNAHLLTPDGTVMTKYEFY